MPSRVAEATLLLLVSIAAAVIAYSYVLPFIFNVFQTVDVKRLEENYVNLGTILDIGGSLNTYYYARILEKGVKYPVRIKIEEKISLDFTCYAPLISSNLSSNNLCIWINTVGNNKTFAFGNESTSTVSRFNYGEKDMIILYKKPKVEIVVEQDGEEIQIIKITMTLDRFILKNPSGMNVPKEYLDRNMRIFVELINITTYPTLVWSSTDRLKLEIGSKSPFFDRNDEITIGSADNSKYKIYKVEIKILYKTIKFGG